MRRFRAFGALLVGILLSAAFFACAGAAKRLPAVVASDGGRKDVDSGFDVESFDANGIDFDGSDVFARSLPCAAACARLRALVCPEAETLDGGKSCFDLCAETQETGKFDLRPTCIAKATTIEEVQACGTVRCRRFVPKGDRVSDIVGKGADGGP